MSDVRPHVPHGIEKPHHSLSHNLAGILLDVKWHFHVGLRSQIVDFVGLQLSEDPVRRGGIVEVSVVEFQSPTFLERVHEAVQVVDPLAVVGGGSPDDPLNLVALGQYQLHQVGTVLAGDPCHETTLCHNRLFYGLPFAGA